jgi:hypothetical protein
VEPETEEDASEILESLAAGVETVVEADPVSSLG